MLPRDKSTRVEHVVNRQDPSTWLKPDEPLIGADGRDWSWAYIWHKDTPDWPGHKIGSDGSVWSSLRLAHGPGRTLFYLPDGPWKRLKLSVSHGYLMVNVSLLGEKRRYRRVHHLVLEAFYGPCPAGMEACHINGKRNDPRFINLRWGTRPENAQDKHRHGTDAKGSEHGSSKLTEPQVLELVRRCRAGEDPKYIVASMGVSSDNLYAIARGDTWSHLTGITRDTALFKRTHCPHGHELTESNIYAWRNRRSCLTCREASNARRREKRKESKPETTDSRARALAATA